MTDLISRSFHCFWLPCRNFPPKLLERPRISAPISLPKQWMNFTHQTHMFPNATSPSRSGREDLDIISVTECEDGSFLFRFGKASEIRDKREELDKEKLAREGVEKGGKAGDRAVLSESVEKLNSEEDGHNLEEEIESSSIVAARVSDQIPQHLMNEKESVALGNDSETPVINDSQKVDRHLKLDTVEDGDDEQGNLDEDVADECNGVPSVSKEDSELDSREEVVGSTVAPESDMLSDLNNDASGKVEEEEEADNGYGVDRATYNLSGAVDADLSELVPESTSSQSELVGFRETNDLIGGVDADLSDSVPVSTSVESGLVANHEEPTQLIVDDSIDASKMGKSEMIHSLIPSSDLENNIDAGNTERSDDESTSQPTVPQICSVEMSSHEEKASRTKLFLVSDAACLPHPSKALTGGEDAYFISCQNWLAVADGVGQWSLEGSNAGLHSRELIEKCENIVSNHENISTVKPAQVITRSAAETQSPGSSAVLVAYFDGQVLHAANVGNTGFIIIRDGSIFKKSTPMFHEFNFPLQVVNGDDPSDLIEGYMIDLHDGDVIVTATNGLFDNLYEQEIASIISKSLQASLTPQEIAEFLAMRAHEVGRSTSTRSPFADAAQAVGYVGYTGGKLDDVTVILSLVQTR
ncbi:hypothetical protein VNO77_22265 [Canavalia gladiata]|uniref:Protein phosphatase n=1 Tax=Canavalia gladiata TaxID=3824 RepID=A0AAN9L5I4_CANGL